MIELSVPLFQGREIEYLRECIETSWVSTRGPMVTRFEEEFAAFVGARHAVAACSGTAAIHATLLALGIGPGDEVIVPALTFIASANPVCYAGAKPVFADVDRTTWGLDAGSVRSMLSRRTRAIIAVHLYGFLEPLDDLFDLAGEHGIPIIEDATEALGTTCRGRAAGTFGTVACFSFNGNKIMTTGSGGMAVTDDDRLRRGIHHLTTQARSHPVRYEHDAVGYNYRMPNINAALGLAQLEQLPGFLRRKKEMAALYRDQLNDLESLELPEPADGVEPNFWLYCALLKPDRARITRDELVSRLQDRGIQSRPFFLPLTQCRPYREAPSAPLPVADYLAEHGLCLPSAVKLTDGQIMTVCEALYAELG